MLYFKILEERKLEDRRKLRMTRTFQRVLLEVSIHWRYLHQDVGKSCLKIAMMRSYGKYSKATLFRHQK